MGGIALAGLMAQTRLRPGDIDKVIVANVVPNVQGLDRKVLDEAGWDLAGSTESELLNTVCCSGLHACINAQILIESDYADCVIVVGTESMTNALPVPNPDEDKYAKKRHLSSSDILGLTSYHDGRLMFMIAEDHRKKFELVRADMDAIAIASFRNAYAAAELMADYIIPVKGVNVDGETFTIDHDVFRADRKTWKELHIDEAAIKNARSYLDRRDKKSGEVLQKGHPTLLNVSSKNDGAGAMLICSDSFARRKGLKAMGRFGQFANVYTQPGDLFEAPVKAAKLLMKKGKFSVDDVYMWMLTEAFGNQAAQNLVALGIDGNCVNCYGGAIAKGHPIGASGLFREMEALIYLMENPEAERAVAGACGGGGRATMHEVLPATA